MLKLNEKYKEPLPTDAIYAYSAIPHLALLFLIMLLFQSFVFLLAVILLLQKENIKAITKSNYTPSITLPG